MTYRSRGRRGAVADGCGPHSRPRTPPSTSGRSPSRCTANRSARPGEHRGRLRRRRRTRVSALAQARGGTPPRPERGRLLAPPLHVALPASPPSTSLLGLTAFLFCSVIGISVAYPCNTL